MTEWRGYIASNLGDSCWKKSDKKSTHRIIRRSTFSHRQIIRCLHFFNYPGMTIAPQYSDAIVRCHRQIIR
uniref:Uncharacterized protein n=1 Tax=Arundo donax TaxID=35708 RepID=A0A0A9EH44_ARUDO